MNNCVLLPTCDRGRCRGALDVVRLHAAALLHSRVSLPKGSVSIRQIKDTIKGTFNQTDQGHDQRSILIRHIKESKIKGEPQLPSIKPKLWCPSSNVTSPYDKLQKCLSQRHFFHCFQFQKMNIGPLQT